MHRAFTRPIWPRGKQRLRSAATALSGAVVVCLVLLSSVHVSCADTAASRENLLKAAFIYNFAKFVEWPPVAGGGVDAPLTLCVRGKAVFEAARSVLDGKTVRNRRLVVTPGISENAACSIVFFSAADTKPDASVLSSLNKQNVLTISDFSGFTKDGGTVGLVTIDNKIRFDVNLNVARSGQLRISSKLLKLARKVTE